MATRREETIIRLYGLQGKAWPLFTQREYHSELARMFPRLAGGLAGEYFDAWGAMTDDELALLLSETEKIAAGRAYQGAEVT